MPIASPSGAQHAGAERVERARRDVAAALADEADDPLAQLRRGPVGEGHGQDPPWGDVLDADEVGDPVGQDAGLAGAGAGEDQQRAFRSRHGPCLLRVERPDDLLLARGADRGGQGGRIGRRVGGAAGSSPVVAGVSRSHAGSSGAADGASSRSVNAVPAVAVAASAAASRVGSPVLRRRRGLTRSL